MSSKLPVLSIFRANYHWTGLLYPLGTDLRENKRRKPLAVIEIPRYGNGDFCRHDPWDHLARALLDKADALGIDTVRARQLVEERWAELERARKIQLELSGLVEEEAKAAPEKDS